MVRKFYDLHDPTVVNPMIEINYNTIIRLVVQKFESESGEVDLVNLMRIYHFMSMIPYSNSVTKRCNFILEQKGMALASQAEAMNISQFVSALIKNGKFSFARRMIPYIMSTMDKSKFGRLIHTAYDISVANLETPELVKRVRQEFELNGYIERLRELEYTLMLYFFVKNQKDVENPDFFLRFERRSFMIRNHFTLDILKSILETLSRSDKPIFSKNFFKEFEAKLSQKPGELKDDLLLLIFQEQAKFQFESTTFWQRLATEAFTRSDRLSPEQLVMVFANFTNNNGFFPNILQKFTETICNVGISSLKPENFETLLLALYQFDTSSLVKPSQELRKLSAKYVISKSGYFTIQQLESVLEKRSFFAVEDHKEIITGVQHRIMQGNGFSKDNLDLKTLCNITNICLSEFPNDSQPEFVCSIIDLSMALLIENAKDETLNIPNSLEIYGNFLSLVSQQNLDRIYTEKRKKLFQIFEQHLIKLHKKTEPILEEPSVEDNLSKYVDALYSILERSNEDIEKVHERAKTAYGLV